MSILPQEPAKFANTRSEVSVSEATIPVAQGLNDAHPLESRIKNWAANEEAFKLKLLQRTQGAAEPIKRVMEAELVEKSTFVPSVAGGPSNLHLDILKNKDASIDWEDIHRDETSTFDFHQELQRRMAMK